MPNPEQWCLTLLIPALCDPLTVRNPDEAPRRRRENDDRASRGGHCRARPLRSTNAYRCIHDPGHTLCLLEQIVVDRQRRTHRNPRQKRLDRHQNIHRTMQNPASLDARADREPNQKGQTPSLSWASEQGSKGSDTTARPKLSQTWDAPTRAMVSDPFDPPSAAQPILNRA